MRIHDSSPSLQWREGRTAQTREQVRGPPQSRVADVIKLTVFLRNINDREKVNTVRKEYFGAHRPASTLVEISRLVRDDYLIEIEATAVIPERKVARPRAAKPRARRGRARR